jgi:hypothetical protein
MHRPCACVMQQQIGGNRRPSRCVPRLATRASGQSSTTTVLAPVREHQTAQRRQNDLALSVDSAACRVASAQRGGQPLLSLRWTRFWPDAGPTRANSGFAKRHAAGLHGTEARHAAWNALAAGAHRTEARRGRVRARRDRAPERAGSDACERGAEGATRPWRGLAAPSVVVEAFFD